MEFSRLEYWSGQPFPSAGDLPTPGIFQLLMIAQDELSGMRTCTEKSISRIQIVQNPTDKGKAFTDEGGLMDLIRQLKIYNDKHY